MSDLQDADARDFVAARVGARAVALPRRASTPLACATHDRASATQASGDSAGAGGGGGGTAEEEAVRPPRRDDRTSRAQVSATHTAVTWRNASL